ncbi:hypothetical protein FVW20_04035, partial [Desulfovibrio oxamicus]|nr:hypothetical protein [Nitratidesulfovibrio oxamicus]
MTRREQILIGMAGVAAIVAAVILLLPSGASRPVPTASAPGALSASLAAPANGDAAPASPGAPSPLAGL